MKNLLMTKSSDCKSDLVKGHASRPNKSTGKGAFNYPQSDLLGGYIYTTNL